MKRLDGDTFDRPWLILCEGNGDRHFFQRLIEVRAIGNGRYDVIFPGREKDPSGGRSKFGRWLSVTHEASPSFRENVKVVLIASDNDDDPAASFAKIQAGLQAAGGFGVPKRERVAARKPDYPTIIVFMIPPGEHGNLETLCLRAAYQKWPVEEALNAYVGATPAKDWPLGKQSKGRMQALLAVTCESKPDTTLAWHWQEAEKFHVPVTNSHFDEIVNFLNGLEALLAEA